MRPTTPALLLCAIAACEESASTGQLGSRCSDPTDCLGTLSCVNGSCAAAELGRGFQFEVRPGGGNSRAFGVVREQFSRTEEELQSPLRLVMSNAVTVELQADANGTIQVDVDIARTNPVIAERGLVQRRRVFFSSTGQPQDLTALPLSLISGTYSFVATPLEAGFAPSVLEERQITADPDRVVLPLTPAASVRGTVVRSTQQGEPVAGATVVARGTRSRIASTRPITQDDGSFVLRLPRTDDDAFELTVYPISSDEPAWRFQRIYSVRELEEELLIPLEPPVPEAQRCIELCLVNEDTPRVVRRAQVTLTSTETRDPTVHFEVSGTTNDLGCLEVFDPVRAGAGVRTSSVTLMAGVYDVFVRPPGRASDSDRRDNPETPPVQFPEPTGLVHANTLTTLTVDLAPGTPSGADICDPASFGRQQLRVPSRPLVLGEVDSPNHLSPAATQLVFNRTELPEFTVQVTANATDRFTVYLEPGDYAWRALPSGADLRRVPVATGTLTVRPRSEGAMQGPFEFEVPDGVLVEGQVFAPDGVQPLARAEVDAFTTVSGRTLRLGIGQTDDAGRFVMVLPVE